MKLNVYGANLRDQSKGQFVVHASDCANCKKLAHEHMSKMEAHCKLEVSADIFADDIREGSSTAEECLCEIYFAPCVKIPVGKVVNGEIQSCE